MNVAMPTALNRAPEIKLHVKGALNNIVTVAEIRAALLHATAYCGTPAGLDAFRAGHEVLVSEGALAKTRNVGQDDRGNPVAADSPLEETRFETTFLRPPHVASG